MLYTHTYTYTDDLKKIRSCFFFLFLSLGKNNKGYLPSSNSKRKSDKKEGRGGCEICASISISVWATA